MSPPLTSASLLGTPGVIGVYNSTGLLRCSDFRNDSTKNFFKVWPEDIYNFSYCCEDGSDHKYNLFNFTYSKHGARIISRPYFDLGYVETLLSPYWKQWRFWQVPQRKIVLENFNCDFTDLHHLYTYRFWTKVMRDGTFLALKLILLLQSVVIAFVVLKWFWDVCCHVAIVNKCRQKGGRSNSSSPSKESWSCYIQTKTGSDMRRWWLTQPRWEDWISDVLHMYLIVVVGGSLIEGTGHSDPTKWRAIILYNTAVVYAWMTLLCLTSTVLRQVTVSWFDESEQDDEIMQQRRRETYKKKKQKSILNPNQLQLATAYDLQKEARPNRTLLKITEDWRWQRVFGQLAVVILIGTYLMFVDDDSGSAMDNIAALMFAAIVVACMWSGGVGLVVTARALAHIFRHLFYPPQPATGEDLDIEKEMSMVFYPPFLPQPLHYQHADGNLYPPPPPPPINNNNNHNNKDGGPLYQGAANRRGSR